MSNPRIKDIPGMPGIQSEAIASTINIVYKPDSPLDTRVTFAFQNFLRGGEGEAIPFASGTYDLIEITLAELVDMPLDTSAITLMEAIRQAADLVYARKYGDANGSELQVS